VQTRMSSHFTRQIDDIIHKILIMASAHPVGKKGNSWRLKWKEPGNPKPFFSKTFHGTKQEADEQARQKTEELDRLKKNQLLINDLWDEYKRGRPRRNNKPHTPFYWNRVLEYFDNCPVTDITKLSINQWKNWLL